MLLLLTFNGRMVDARMSGLLRPSDWCILARSTYIDCEHGSKDDETLFSEVFVRVLIGLSVKMDECNPPYSHDEGRNIEKSHGKHENKGTCKLRLHNTPPDIGASTDAQR